MQGFPELLRFSYPAIEMQERIGAALRQYGGQGAWETAKQLLDQTQWRFFGDPDLDDTGDTGYELQVRGQAGKENLKRIIAGLAQKQLDDPHCGFVMRRIEEKGDEMTLIVSQGSARRLASLTGMELLSHTVEAGRAATVGKT